MAKEKKICPFSRRNCVGCPLFRGRHCGMDFSKLYHEHSEMESPRGQRRAEGADSGKLLMSGIPPQSASWISNVEELVERREG
jgi:hypothetical protein